MSNNPALDPTDKAVLKVAYHGIEADLWRITFVMNSLETDCDDHRALSNIKDKLSSVIEILGIVIR